MVDQCKGKTKERKPCGAKPRPGSAYCPWHDPALASKRVEWSAKGGANRSNQVRASKAIPADSMTNADAHAHLSLAFRKTFAGTMEPGVLNALSTASKALADLARVVDFEEQLAEMRAQIVDLSERRGAS